MKHFVHRDFRDLKPKPRENQLVAGLILGIRVMKPKKGTICKVVTLDDRTAHRPDSVLGSLPDKFRGLPG